MLTLGTASLRAVAAPSRTSLSRTRVVLAAAKPDLPQVVRLSRRAGLLSGIGLLSLGLQQAKADDALGEALTELEIIEPIVEEDLAKIQAIAGSEELKEVIADVKEVEASLKTLEQKAETAGSESAPEFTDAVAPLKDRLKQLNDLIALFGK